MDSCGNCERAIYVNEYDRVKMERQRKKRAENWSRQERSLLRDLVAQSANVIEDKSTKTLVNIKKSKEWKDIATKFNKITMKHRSIVELKLAWKRMKMSARAKLRKPPKKVLRPSPEPETVLIAEVQVKPRKEVKHVPCANPTSGARQRIEEIHENLENNISIRGRQLEMSKVEHQYNIEIAKLKMKKLRLQIDLLKRSRDY